MSFYYGKWYLGISYKWYDLYVFNYLPKKHRFWGKEVTWYDGYHYAFGFWFFNVGFSK